MVPPRPPPRATSGSAPAGFARSGATEEGRRAATAGGRISCISLLAESGVYRPPDERLQLALAPSSRARLAATAGETAAHWSQLCQPADMAVAVVDSVLHNRVLTRAAVDAVFVTMPRRIQRLRARVDRRSESGIESLRRFRLALAGIECTPQVVYDWAYVEAKIRARLSRGATR